MEAVVWVASLVPDVIALNKKVSTKGEDHDASTTYDLLSPHILFGHRILLQVTIFCGLHSRT